MKKIPVGILGATGVIGQSYVHLLQNHPWFTISHLSASPKWEGASYEEATASYSLFPKPSSPLPPLKPLLPSPPCRLLFSALPSYLAQEVECPLATKGFAVISSSSSHREEDDVPLIIPEINPDHLALLAYQQKKRGWKTGLLLAKPNCSIQSFLLPLAPLHQAFGIASLSVTTLQALSGAGLSALTQNPLSENVSPFIPGEEEKTEQEPLKILGAYKDRKITPENFPITAHCNRVPISHGHLACVSVAFHQKPTQEQILNIWKRPSPLTLPTSPRFPILYREEEDRPQPLLDRDHSRGMTVTTGRLRPCPLLDWRFTALSHNTLRGGAGSGLLLAELLHSQNLLP
ncbi:MAG: Aspartate-semialdehyde dehydrogenase 2 [Chlamydiae bacterium]|nr:Aspartate-semialdehyde dehydrogenase 2 [Chlamydiota bacterium]